MAARIKELEQRVEGVEAEMRRLARLVEDPEEMSGPPMDGTLDEWLARLRAKKGRHAPLDDLRRSLGIPTDLEPIGAKAIREMMLADGVRPEDRILSSEIIRMREE